MAVRELGIDVPLVVSNHEGCRALAEREQIRFEFISFEDKKNRLPSRSLAASCARPERNWSCWRGSCRSFHGMAVQ